MSFLIQNANITKEIKAVQATVKDTASVKSLLYRTAEWLQSIGSTQWYELLEGKDKHQTAIAIEHGYIFLFKEKEKVAGMVMLLPEPSKWDKNLWGSTNHKQAIYLHRLAINREYAGRKLGQYILDWVEHGVLFPGKYQIRLDCITDNSNLNKLYRSMGYIYKGTIDGFNTYEKWIGIK